MSDNRMYSTVWFVICSTAVAIVFLISSCSLNETKAELPISAMKVKSDHVLKLECIKNKGNWVSTDDDRSPPYSCKF